MPIKWINQSWRTERRPPDTKQIGLDGHQLIYEYLLAHEY